MALFVTAAMIAAAVPGTPAAAQDAGRKYIKVASQQLTGDG